jgi:hypothetical protein
MSNQSDIQEYRRILESVREGLNKMTPALRVFSTSDIKKYGDLYRDVAELMGRLNCLESRSCNINVALEGDDE